jgi:hypothetical protein
MPNVCRRTVEERRRGRRFYDCGTACTRLCASRAGLESRVPRYAVGKADRVCILDPERATPLQFGRLTRLAQIGPVQESKGKDDPAPSFSGRSVRERTRVAIRARPDRARPVYSRQVCISRRGEVRSHPRRGYAVGKADRVCILDPEVLDFALRGQV